MRFALQAGAPTYEGMLAWARFAESRGLDAYAIPDHYLRRGDDVAEPALDALAVMAGLARETSTIELVLLVSPITWRHPAVLAKTAATISEMSGGRLTLGVGTGWLEREHTLFGLPFPERGVRFEMLEEALGYLRAAFHDPPLDFEGAHYRFQAFDMLPRPPLRLVIGGTGTRTTPRLAGTYCDELNAYPAPPDVFASKVAVARAAATEAGRDPGALVISSSGIVVAGDTPAAYRERLEELAERFDGTPEDIEESMRVRNSPHGTWEDVRATLRGMEEAGMSRYFIQEFGDGPEGIDRALERLA